MRKVTLLVAAIALQVPVWLAAAPPLAHAGTPFDGQWSVSIVTEAGDTCDRAYRYALRITDGRITYDDPSFDVSGHVAANGQVRVVVRAGRQEAVGTGRLSRDSGEGVWSGHSPSARCSGYWDAERRD
jgi:hypothetical protein